MDNSYLQISLKSNIETLNDVHSNLQLQLNQDLNLQQEKEKLQFKLEQVNHSI
jgi:hypothetical protein